MRLIDELRRCGKDSDTYKNSLFREAADRIEELERENRELRKKIADRENEDSWRREAETRQYMGCW